MPISVYIADKRKILRQGLLKMIEFDSDLYSVGDTSDGYKCISGVTTNKPDVVIMSTALDTISANRTCDILKKNYPNIKCILLSDNNDNETLYQAMEYGFKGFITDDCDFDTFKAAVVDVYNNKKYIQKDVMKGNDSKEHTERELQQLNSLSERETMVLKLLCHGMSNKQIAEELNISEYTVKNHMANILRKLEVNDRTQAIVFAIKNGFLRM